MWWHLKANVVILQLLIAGASCFVNVAHTPTQRLQGTATMSEPPHSTGWTADKVVDGNTDQTASGGSCAIMNFDQNYKSVWLKVQLGRRFNVAYIELYLRNERLLDRSAGFSIYAFYNDTFDPASPSPNDFVYHHDPLSGCPAAVQNITINRLVRQIVFTNNRPDGFQTNCIGTNSNLYTSIEICEIKVMGCDTGRYSTGCLSVCPSCKNKNCDAFNGSCVDKCPDPNALTESCIVCADGQYISNGNCVNCKGHCKNGEHCNKLTGECDSGCATQWTGNFCDQCKDHFYGSDCITPCGHCLNNDTCDKGTGQCLNGCMPYWQMNKCDICSNHFYGTDCDTPCGHCINNDVCDKATGHCPRGCQSHWTGNRCDVCTDHFYGKDCNKVCGYCMNNSVCDKETGRCPYGCQAQWTGEKCDVCINHFYGNDCNTPCGKCKNYSVCDKGTGHCLNGCQSHWKGEQCNICNDHFYGQNCNISCGHCKNNGGCNNITGQCPDGCQANWQGEKCDECTDGFYNANCTERCGHCTDSEVCDKQNGSCVNGCSQNFQMPLCQVRMEKESEVSEINKGAVAGGVVSILVVLASVGVVGVIYRRRRGGRSKETQSNTMSKPSRFSTKQSSKGKKYTDLTENPLDVSSDEYINVRMTGDEGGYYNTTELNTFIHVDDLQRVIQEKSTGENNVFQSEYKRLPAGNTSVCKEGKKQENMVKNRFKTTFPYDHSRIVLSEKWTDADNDYINANFIKDFNGKRTYIAAQGPKNNTLVDFWRMIWQENVRFIVMLTNIVENGKNKCTQYWPGKDNLLEVGQLKIQLLKETTYAFYTYRKFNVQNTKSTVKRTITQYHYTAWPDHGTPEEIGLVQFHTAVTRKYQSDGLMLVHCSAGVGRTGTFIGLDSLLKQGKETGRINVFEFVKQMREDRMTMVQTPDQYIFLHKALLFGFQDKDTVTRESDIPTKLNALLQDSSPLNQRVLYKEYKFLQTVKPVFEDDDKEDGMKSENKEKNANMNVIPVSKYRPYLTSYVKGRNDYINAVCVPSFSNLRAFILTQAPLPETKVDLWTLCVDYDVKAIVILSENNEETQWVPKRDCSCICSPYTLTSGETGSSISGVTQDTLLIQTDGTRQDVDVFHIPSENDDAMLKGVELLLEKGKESEFTSVFISKDGAGPAGIFCAFHNTLQQLRIDGEVDIMTTVRLIQTRRPEVITKLEEYKRCYELLSLSLSEDGIYANM